MPEEPFEGFYKLPKTWQRQIEDGLATWQVNTPQPASPSGYRPPLTGLMQGPSREVIAAMTPEQREYYGLTLPPESWPQ